MKESASGQTRCADCKRLFPDADVVDVDSSFGSAYFCVPCFEVMPPV